MDRTKVKILFQPEIRLDYTSCSTECNTYNMQKSSTRYLEKLQSNS